MADTFVKLSYELLKMKTYTDYAGNEFKITPAIKLVYLYIKSRFDFFKSSGKDYYDTNKEIGIATGIDEQVVIRAVKELIKMGLVEKKIIKYRNLPKNVFTKVNPMSTTTTNNIPKASQQPTQNTPPPDLSDYDPDKDDDNEWFPF